MNTACIIFTGAKDKNGYGWQRKNGERKAHRVAYVENKGEIPKGLLVCHHCDNPSCINPDHLFLGTPLDNMQDKIRKGRAVYGIHNNKGEKNPNTELTEEDVKAIRSRYKWGSGPTLGKEYGVSSVQICRIVRGEQWR